MSDDEDHHLRPRRTHLSTKVWRLVGGTEDNDLWTQIETDDDGVIMIRSTWVPSDKQRQRIADGENIELITWGAQPPVALMLTSVPIGKAPDVER
jgi:hypothetical protein